jgi:hypothetical protein
VKVVFESIRRLILGGIPSSERPIASVMFILIINQTHLCLQNKFWSIIWGNTLNIDLFAAF